MRKRLTAVLAASMAMVVMTTPATAAEHDPVKDAVMVGALHIAVTADPENVDAMMLDALTTPETALAGEDALGSVTASALDEATAGFANNATDDISVYAFRDNHERAAAPLVLIVADVESGSAGLTDQKNDVAVQIAADNTDKTASMVGLAGTFAQSLVRARSSG